MTAIGEKVTYDFSWKIADEDRDLLWFENKAPLVDPFEKGLLTVDVPESLRPSLGGVNILTFKEGREETPERVHAFLWRTRSIIQNINLLKVKFSLIS